MKLTLPEPVTNVITKALVLKRYLIVMSIVLVLGLYAYVVLHINQAVSVQPDAAQQTAAKKVTPHIDANLVNQLQQLQDNSVSVQALFNQARTNPFQ